MTYGLPIGQLNSHLGYKPQKGAILNLNYSVSGPYNSIVQCFKEDCHFLDSIWYKTFEYKGWSINVNGVHNPNNVRIGFDPLPPPLILT